MSNNEELINKKIEELENTYSSLKTRLYALATSKFASLEKDYGVENNPFPQTENEKEKHWGIGEEFENNENMLNLLELPTI